MKTPKYVNKIIKKLAAAGYRAYPVGGCVRDALLGKTPADWDLTTDARPEEVLALFGRSAIPTGPRHGTVMILRGDRSVDVTTMRRDGAYRDNRHPESVVFTDNIEDDLARRDFTVNAMALLPDGALIDPFGGRDDLARGVLRCVGDPRERFKEDALRILRLLRFASVLGFTVDAAAAEAARAYGASLQTVAAERVYMELNKLLCGDGVTDVLLAFPDVLGVVLPELLPCVGFEQRDPRLPFDVWEHTARSVGAIPPRRELRWAMLLHGLGKPRRMSIDSQNIGNSCGHASISVELAEEIMPRLRFDKKTKAAILAQLACFDDPLPPERVAIHKEMVKRGKAVVGDLLLTRLADAAAQAADGFEDERGALREAQAIYNRLIEEDVCCSVHDLAISGADVAALGFSKRTIGAVLGKLLDEVAAEELPNERDALLRRAQWLKRSGFRRPPAGRAASRPS